MIDVYLADVIAKVLADVIAKPFMADVVATTSATHGNNISHKWFGNNISQHFGNNISQVNINQQVAITSATLATRSALVT